MRVAFLDELQTLSAEDDRVMLLTADLGFGVVESYAQRFPDRFLNVGVAEQSMIGVASGLAEAGYIPFIYSIAPFALLRPYEFLRNLAVHERRPVRFVGVGGGFEYGPAGPTHHALEDVAVTRAHPGLMVIAPADHEQARSALRATWDAAGPIYYRLGKDDRKTVTGLKGHFALGDVDVIKPGRGVLILALGTVANQAVEASEILAAEGIDAGVALVPTINPAPYERLAQLINEQGSRLTVTVEAHYLNGGLGSLVAEAIAEGNVSTRLVRCGVGESPSGSTGSEGFLLARHHLDAEGMAETVRKSL